MRGMTRRAQRCLDAQRFAAEMGRAEQADHFAAVASAADRVHGCFEPPDHAKLLKAEALLHIALSTSDRNIRDTATCRAWRLLSEGMGGTER